MAETETTEVVEEPERVEDTTEAETPAETPSGKTETPEGEAPAEEKAAAPEIPEDTLKAAAEKYANRTMAAARVAEKKARETVAENATLKAEVGVYKEFVGQLNSDPLTALQRAGIGNGTVKGLLEFIQEKGEPKASEPDEDNDFAAWRRKQKAREEQAAREAKIEEGKKAVFAAVDEKKAEYPRVSTNYGKRELWSAIEEYHKLHGSVPDEIVWDLAGRVERALRSEFGDPIPASPAETKQGAPAGGNAASPARTGGKTLTNRASGASPVEQKYNFVDEEEYTRQILAEMKAAGELA